MMSCSDAAPVARVKIKDAKMVMTYVDGAAVQFTVYVPQSLYDRRPDLNPARDAVGCLWDLAVEARGYDYREAQSLDAMQKHLASHHVAIDSVIDLGVTEIPEAVELLKLLRGKTREECARLLAHVRDWQDSPPPGTMKEETDEELRERLLRLLPMDWEPRTATGEERRACARCWVEMHWEKRDE